MKIVSQVDKQTNRRVVSQAVGQSGRQTGDKRKRNLTIQTGDRETRDKQTGRHTTCQGGQIDKSAQTYSHDDKQRNGYRASRKGRAERTCVYSAYFCTVIIRFYDRGCNDFEHA